MRLTPRYDIGPVIAIEAPYENPGALVIEQRARFARVGAGLTEAQWNTPSRCDAWRVRDVIAHLVGVNQFWALAVSAGLAGEPTRLLLNFDPVATPAQMVAATNEQSTAELLDAFAATNDALAAVFAKADDASWSMLAEAPPGHIELRALALHALWDSWIHERDVLLPLGLAQELDVDEIRGSLQYAAALGPAFLASPCALRVEVDQPDVSFVVEAGDRVVVREGPAAADTPVVRGDAVSVLEALSFRAPLPADFPDAARRASAGLAEAFDTVV